jgi:hypothetical protein
MAEKPLVRHRPPRIVWFLGGFAVVRTWDYVNKPRYVYVPVVPASNSGAPFYRKSED